MTDDELRAMFEALRREGAANAEALRSDISGLRGEVSGLRGEVSELRGETSGLRGEVIELRGETSGLRGEVSQLRDETHKLGITTERLDHKIDLVAEGVTALGETLQREAADMRAEFRRTAAETQAMIKFSHAELDRRVSKLEDAVTDLQARVERLEGSTH